MQDLLKRNAQLSNHLLQGCSAVPPPPFPPTTTPSIPTRKDYLGSLIVHAA
jgi:hypothetical protein